MAQVLFTGYCDNIQKLGKKTDQLPYEQFPFCCNSDNTLKAEADLAKKNNTQPLPPPKQQPK